ncbi:hypothetical protein L1987_07247 [Smallanthus sonchifolius]|uniref:Uncharacterized protein n=1 Tax=Smallanthus sonchifolius TaxID=185202 RepID=A0ACB9K089_9ASTR|nr:hypothetical protein L1987_07247 [Smallanthus sonchifolius]
MVEGSSKLLRGLDWARSWALSETNQTLRRNSTRYRVTTSIVDESGSATTVFFYEVMASMVGIIEPRQLPSRPLSLPLEFHDHPTFPTQTKLLSVQKHTILRISNFSASGKNKTAATKRSESGSSKVQGSHPLCSVDIPNSPTPPGATGSGSTANRPSFHHQETK